MMIQFSIQMDHMYTLIMLKAEDDNLDGKSSDDVHSEASSIDISPVQVNRVISRPNLYPPGFRFGTVK